MGATFSTPVQTGSGVSHSLLYEGNEYRVSFPEVKRPQRRSVKHPPPFGAKVKHGTALPARHVTGRPVQTAVKQRCHKAEIHALTLASQPCHGSGDRSRSLTEWAQVQSHVYTFGICSGPTVTETEYSPSTSVLPRQHHFNDAS